MKACLQHLFKIGLPVGFGGGADFHVNETSTIIFSHNNKKRGAAFYFLAGKLYSSIYLNIWVHKLFQLSFYLNLCDSFTCEISGCHIGVISHGCGAAWWFCMGGLNCAGVIPPALALACSFSQVLVHCSPEFSLTCCIDIQGLFLIPITALSLFFSLSSLSPAVWLPPSEALSLSLSLFPYLSNCLSTCSWILFVQTPL